jgi:hypothetical protein
MATICEKTIIMYSLLQIILHLHSYSLNRQRRVWVSWWWDRCITTGSSAELTHINILFLELCAKNRTRCHITVLYCTLLVRTEDRRIYGFTVSTIRTVLEFSLWLQYEYRLFFVRKPRTVVVLHEFRTAKVLDDGNEGRLSHSAKTRWAISWNLFENWLLIPRVLDNKKNNVIRSSDWVSLIQNFQYLLFF